MGLFVPLAGNASAPFTGQGDVLVPDAEVPTEHALYHFAWAALAVSTVTLNVTELWPPDTGPGPGANSIKQIRNLLHRGQKDEVGLRRKGRKTRRKRNRV